MRVRSLAALVLALASLAVAAACQGGGGAAAGGSPTPTPTGTGTGTPAPTGTPDPASMTYYKDVLPIVQQHCMPCHTAGGLSVSLDQVAVAQAEAPLMATRTANRTMPPWPPEPACGQTYVGARLLSDLQKATINSWNIGGAKAGNPADAPTPTPTPAPTATPDVTLTPASFTYKTTDPADYYYCFDLGKLPAQKDFVAAQIYPGNSKIVHHVILYKIPNGTLATGSCGGIPSNSAEFQVGWTPGAAPLQFPANTGMRLLATDQLVMQVHYHGPPASNQTDQTSVALWFSAAPVANVARVIWGGNAAFQLPSDGMPHSASGTCTLPSNVTLLGLAPHMHLLGTKFNATLDPAGANTCMVDIQKWDFGWQGGYMYDTPKQLTAGQKLETTCTWVNSTGSTVGFGEGTNQEMCLDFFYMVGYSGASQFCAL